MKQVLEKLTSYSVYLNGSDFLGTADVQLPSLEYLTETVKGAGIAGEVDSPTIGHFGSMSVTLNWRAVDPNAVKLAAPKTHALDFRGAQQTFNASSGSYDTSSVKVSVRTIPKKFDIGKFDVGSTTDSTNEFEVIYMKMVINDATLVEIDKFNYICIIDGVDYLAKVREALGI
ncbi:phage major tail tube protein [Paenibacillus sp. UNC451MF]|uniref:phage major tail tube protein n=1 Tax=Paenibacillus sp. UNC451MF TaxID=1449063 RepID=UPI00048A6BE8|nr:phage major tail tube protein [Paenibacillus sp. UNC451MF]